MRYPSDPFWKRVSFDQYCTRCGRTIQRDTRAFYYPIGRRILCAETCGEAAARDFEAHRADEDGY